MPPKVQRIQFDERGGVILPAGSLAPSEETLLARAYLLQGQEARRDVDQLATTSIATPDELKSFVGGRSDLTPGDILGAKVAQASAAQLREGVAQAALVQVGATNAVRGRVEAADAAARAAAAAAEKLAQLQLQATTDGTAALADKIEEARITAEDAAEIAEKQAADLLAAATPPGAPMPAKTKAGAPMWFTNLQADVAKAGAKGDPNAADAAKALDQLAKREIWSTMRSQQKRANMSRVDRALLRTVEKTVTASQITLRSGSAIREVMDQIRADGMAAAMPSTPVGPIAAPLPSVPTTPPAGRSSPAPPAGLPAPLIPTPAPQTGSGLEASEVPAWKLGAARAMDLAETGDQVGALRLLTKYAATMPEDKSAQVYAFVLAQHVKYTQRDGQL